MRKTVKIVDALARANYFLKHSDDDRIREREATAAFLESLLHLADAYHGFRFMDNVNGDESRRQYFVPRALEADLKAAMDKLAH